MSATSSRKSYGFVALVLILQIMIYFMVYANVPIARMVVCFLYLMFVPGIVILKLLEMKNLDTAEKILFSTGLSIAFLMFIGLIINEIGRLAFTNPLSLNLLLFSINTVILLMSLALSRRDSSSLLHLPKLKRSESLFPILLSISLIALGSYGIFIVNVSGNSFLLLILMVATSIAVSLVFLSEKALPSNCYPLILFVICVCMLFFISSNTSLITKYITGNGDQWIEYYAFRLTETQGFWNSAAASSPLTPVLFPTYSMTSVTILPVIFSTISGMDGSSVFKFLYPLIVSFIALGAYKLYQTQTGNKEAFLAVFFLITILTGKGWGSSKQEVAQLFYVLLFLLLFKSDISTSKRNVLLIVFAASLVISHYALAYIFLLTILFVFLVSALVNYRKTGKFSTSGTKITLTFVLIFFAITFAWYIFVNSSATFGYLSDAVNTVTGNFGQFFNLQSRGTALAGLGLVETPTIFQQISAALFVLTEFLIVVGFVKLLASRKRLPRFSSEYKIIAAFNIIVLAVNVLLPRIADTFLMSRFYITTLIILAPIAVLGGKTIVELIPRPKIQKLYAPILVFLVFIPLFLFQTGFIYETAKVQSSSLPLSMYRWNDLELYGYIVDSQEVTSAQWLAKCTSTNSIFVYSDTVSQDNVLVGYGMMEIGRVSILSNTTKPTLEDYVYLANIDLINKGEIFNASEISPILQNQNMIYSNGKSEIYNGYAP